MWFAGGQGNGVAGTRGRRCAPEGCHSWSVSVRARAHQDPRKGFLTFLREPDFGWSGSSLTHRCPSEYHGQRLCYPPRCLWWLATLKYSSTEWNVLSPLVRRPRTQDACGCCGSTPALGKQHKACAFLVRVGLHSIVLKRWQFSHSIPYKDKTRSIPNRGSHDVEATYHTNLNFKTF